MRYPVWNKDKIVYKINKKDILWIGSADDDVKEIHGNADIWNEIISLIDGEKTIEEIVKTIVNKYDIDEDKANGFIKTFYSNNFIDILPFKYSLRGEMYKYFESILVYIASLGLGGFKLFNELQSLKVVILGCGSGGSHIAYYLAQLGIGNIHLVDPDIISYSNINRQELLI